MEELKLLIEMVAGLPSMAMWVIVALFAYKVVVVGSIYGVIRLGIAKLHDVLISQKTKVVNIVSKIEDITISGCTTELVEQLRRVRGRATGISSDYIHGCSVNWLRQAIDDKIEKDMAEKREKEKKAA